MQPDIIIVTAYERPEFLWLALERIALNPHTNRNAGSAEIWVAIDHHVGFEWRERAAKPEFDRVLAQFSGALRVRRIEREPHWYYGNSYNCLLAYKEAYEADPRFVFLVEDDVLVSEDFCRWHYAVQEQGDWFCSIAVKNHRRNDFAKLDDAAAFYTSRSDYASLGVCFRHEKLGPVVRHAVPEYFGDLTGYIQRAFPKSRFGSEFTEQDGLIMRVMGEIEGVTAWPYVPRAHHMGWYGYHRNLSVRFSGALGERVGKLRHAVADPQAITRLDRDVYKDIEAIPAVPNATWQFLRMVDELP